MEMFPETSGTAALSGRDLPPAAALAADKHLTALAQALKATGIPGTLDTLRARAYLHLLTGQPAATLILPTASPGRPGRDPRPGPGHASPRQPAPGSAHPAARPARSPGSTAPGSTLPGPGPGRWPCPGCRGSVNLTMPLAAWLGWTQSPGDIPGYGPVDADDSRALASLLAQDPAASGASPSPAPPGTPSPTPAPATDPQAHPSTRPPPANNPAPHRTQPRHGHQPASPARAARAGPARATRPPDPRPPHRPDWLRGLTFTTLQTRDCTHPRQSPGYQPSRRPAPPHPDPQPRLHRPRLPPPRRPLRPRPRHPLPPGRQNLRMQPRTRLPPRPPAQANPRLDPHHPGPRHLHLDHPRKPHPHHHPRPILGMKRPLGL